MKNRILYLLLTLTPLSAVAQDISVGVPLPTMTKTDGNLFQMASDSAKGKPVLLQPLYWVKTLIDSSAVATVDRNYIQQEIDNLKAQNIALQNQVNMQNLAASQTAQTAALVADNSAQTQYLLSKLTPATTTTTP